MYLEHFGLAAKPFSKTPDPRFLFPSRQHAEALARLSHALEEREVAVLTGEVGAGKTTLTRALVDEFAGRCRFSLVVNPALPPAQLLAAIAEGFGLSPRRRKSELFGAVAEHAARLDEQGIFPVVLLDEAQLLAGRAAFDELRLLTNLTLDDRALSGLPPFGQPTPPPRLLDKGGEPFRQRIGVAYHVGPLGPEETGAYLSHRLRVAGRASRLFTDAAVEAIHRASGGLPRRVNQVAAHALLEGFARDRETIDADVVEAAASDMEAQLGGPASG
jgi:general secretion pathway protein A